MNSLNVDGINAAAAPLLRRKRIRYEEEDNFEGIRSIDDEINDIIERKYLKSSFYTLPYNAEEDEAEIKNFGIEVLGNKERIEFEKEEVAVKLVDLQIKKLELEKQELKNEIECLNIKIMVTRGEIKKINHALMQLSVDVEKEKTELKKKYMQEHGDEDCDDKYYEELKEQEDNLIKKLEHIKKLINMKYDFFGAIEVYDNDIAFKHACIMRLEGRITSEKKNIWELYSNEKEKLD